MSNRPRVVILSLAPIKIGGIERHILHLIDGLGERYGLHVVGPIEPEFEAAAGRIGKPVGLERVDRPSKLSVPAILRLARLFHRLGADIVHTVEPRGRLLGHLAARMAGVRTVHTFEIAALSYHDLSPVRSFVYRRIEAVYNRHVSDRIIFVSRSDRELYDRYGLSRADTTSVIYNAVDLREFEEIRERRAAIREEVRDELRLPDRAIVACTVGRLAEQKGIDYLIDAVQEIEADGGASELRFVIVGDGELRDELQSRAVERGVQDRILFAGARPAAEVIRILAASDLFVLPSRFECFPFSVVEAMAVGLPCVVTDVGGNGEAVSDGSNGLVIPAGDVTTLAHAIRRLAEAPALRDAFGRRSLETVGRFSTTETIPQVEQVYRSVLEGRS